MDDKELFEFVGKEELQIKEFVRPSVSYWSDAWRRLKKNRFAMIGLVLIIILIVFAIIGPIISPYEYDQTDLNNVYAPMSWKHIFGTDELGRDVLTRVLYGARIFTCRWFCCKFFKFNYWSYLWSISGYLGGRVDNIMMRIVDILYSVPILLIVILLMVVLRPGLTNVFIALGIAYWVGMARIVRGQVLSLKEQEFTLAAKALGADKKRILLKHLIPNTIGPIIITATLLIPDAIFLNHFFHLLV